MVARRFWLVAALAGAWLLLPLAPLSAQATTVDDELDDDLEDPGALGPGVPGTSPATGPATAPTLPASLPEDLDDLPDSGSPPDGFPPLPGASPAPSPAAPPVAPSPAATPPASAAQPGQLSPFSDVPPDHPAYDAVRRLIDEGYLEGYDDGSFKGRKVLTRYDFAVLLAKMLARLDKAKQDKSKPPSVDELMVIDLCREFRQELRLLGIRVNAAERRVDRVERQTDDLARRKSNLKMEGFYRVRQTMANHPVDYTAYPFDYDLNQFRLVTKEGLSPLQQEVYLRFLGTPVTDGTPFVGVEAFAELKGIISGLYEDTLAFRFAETPVVGDAEDSFATNVLDDRRVSLNRAHLWLRAKRAQLRVFSNEAITDLKDPLILLSNDVYRPFSGMEAEGGVKKLTYFASVLQRIEPQWSLGNDQRDLWDLYHQDDDTYQDNFALRMTYAPYFNTPEEKWKSLVLGVTFNETVWDYELPDEFNRVLAGDVQYGRRFGQASLDSELTALATQGRGMTNSTGYKLGMSYRNQGLLATLNGYSMGTNLMLATAESPFIDTEVSFNFKRTPLYQLPVDTNGEQLLRLQARYDVPPELLKSLDHVTLAMLAELKWWGRDDEAPRLTDHDSASRFYLQALADITDRTHFEFRTELQKDVHTGEEVGVLREEEGTVKNDFRFDWRLRDNVALLTDLAFIDDFDSLDPRGDHFGMKRHTLELNSQVWPWLFLKGQTQWVNNSDLQLVHASDEETEGVPRERVNGRDIRRFSGEAVLSSKDDFSLRGQLMFERVRNEFWPVEDVDRHVLVGEFAVNFTRALKARYVHAIDSRDLRNDWRYEHVEDRIWVNGFASILYRPSEVTELELTYGDEYEDPQDQLDNGPFNFFKTAKILSLKAQTAF